MTIEQLAMETGQSVRNIRAHQSRGLLPPPALRGRTGHYSADHVKRLRLIGQMQADGFNLTAIGRVLENERFGEEAVNLRQLLLAGAEIEQPEVLHWEELAALFGDSIQRLQRAVEAGVLTPVGAGRYEASSPAMLRVGTALQEVGVAPELALEAFERLQRHAEASARAIVTLFLEGVWEPFEAAGMPDEQWPEVRRALERLRPMAADVYLAIFEPIMRKAGEDAFGRTIERPRRSGPKNAGGGRSGSGSGGR